MKNSINSFYLSKNDKKNVKNVVFKSYLRTKRCGAFELWRKLERMFERGKIKGNFDLNLPRLLNLDFWSRIKNWHWLCSIKLFGKFWIFFEVWTLTLITFVTVFKNSNLNIGVSNIIHLKNILEKIENTGMFQYSTQKPQRQNPWSQKMNHLQWITQ